jgi:hypothetical protein
MSLNLLYCYLFQCEPGFLRNSVSNEVGSEELSSTSYRRLVSLDEKNNMIGLIKVRRYKSTNSHL